MLIRVISGKTKKAKLLKFVPIRGIRVKKEQSDNNNLCVSASDSYRNCEKQKKQSDKIRVIRVIRGKNKKAKLSKN